METIRIEIINPKARKLLQNLADLQLISIKPQESFSELLSGMREKEAQVPSLDEITKEVDTVREARNAKKA